MSRTPSFLLALAAAAPAFAAMPLVEPDAASDMAVEVVGMRPPSGSTLKANEPVVVTLRYRYARPDEDLMVWARLDAPGLESTYEGAHPDTHPGTGTIERQVALTEPGTARRITVVARDRKLRTVFAKEIPVNYTWIPNPRMESWRDDGVGSRITGVTLSPASPAVLKAGSQVDVTIAFDSTATRPLQPWIQPLTACHAAWDEMLPVAPGATSVHRRFTVGQACALRQLRVALSNAANVKVAERIVDVDLRYVE
ncbi:MAG TPA: hypothetical protein VF457_17180 [Burkholderiaceae bacterium]